MAEISLTDGSAVTIDECCIQLSDTMWWVPFHGWGDDSDQVDGRIVCTDGNVVPGGCDIWSVEALRAECSPPVVAAAAPTELVWRAGDVLTLDASLMGAVSLVVPGATLDDDLVAAALSRFRP